MNHCVIVFCLSLHSVKNGRNTGKDVTKLFTCVTALCLISQKSPKSIRKWWGWTFYHIRRILLTLFLRITDCSDGCSDLGWHQFTSLSEIENWLQKWIAAKDKINFLDVISKIYHSSQWWLLLWLICSVILFENKCKHGKTNERNELFCMYHNHKNIVFISII